MGRGRNSRGRPSKESDEIMRVWMHKETGELYEMRKSDFDPDIIFCYDGIFTWRLQGLDRIEFEDLGEL